MTLNNHTSVVIVMQLLAIVKTSDDWFRYGYMYMLKVLLSHACSAVDLQG